MISKLVTLFFMALLFVGSAQEQEQMLIGEITVADLKQAPYSKWYKNAYADYDLRITAQDSLKVLLDGIELKVFMGTWCSDSQREIPRFFKILDSLDYALQNIGLVAVNRDKITPDMLEKGFDILRVPTFIFYKDGSELGRIVEYPIESMETDMLTILSGEEYLHAYAQ